MKAFAKKTALPAQKRPALLLLAIMLLLSAYMVYWGTQKEGYYVDEMFSMMDIRGGGLGRPYNEEGFFNTWHKASDLETTIGVTAENAFTAVGQSRNLHSNLLHIAYSLKPGAFSLWPSLVLNIAIFAAGLAIIYLLSRLFIENKYLALLPCLMWGLSSAAVNLVLFIRFYTLKTFMCLLITYLVFVAVKSGFGKWRHLVAIVLAAGVGVFIHQYFIVYIFYLTVFVCFYLLLNKEIKPLIKFAGAMLAAAVAYELFTMGAISSLFAGTASDRAEESLRMILYGNPEFLTYLHEYLGIIGKAVFGNLNIYAALAISLMLAAVTLYARAKKGADVTGLLTAEKTFLWIVLCGICLAYLLTIAYIAPLQEVRYIFCITPFISILFCSLLISALKAVNIKRAAVIFAAVSLISMLLPVGNVRNFDMHWGAVKTDEALASCHRLPVICIGNRGLEVATCYWEFFEFEDRVLFATIGDVDYAAIGGRTYDGGLILMLWWASDISEIERVMDAAGLKSCTYIADLVGHTVYYLS